MYDFSLYRTLLSQTNWQTDESSLPISIADWLMHTDSLTQKMQQICTSLTVQIVQEGWQIFPSSHFAKNSSNHTACWVREVMIHCGESEWIFAQTIIPQDTINQVAETVLSLGNSPIGLWLFPQKPERLSLEWQQDTESGLYARRSQLCLKGYPLEIKELFLAQFPFEATLKEE